MNKRVVTFLCFFFLAGSFSLPNETGQSTNPFYLQRLENGERAFLAGDIEEAVKELEIALFGLGGDRELKAKACLYLGLSHHILKNNEQAKKYLIDAKNLADMELIRAFICDEDVWAYLNRVLVELKILAPDEKQEAPPENQLKPPLQKRIDSGGETNIASDLERQIKSNPKEVSLYYELYEHYTNNNETGSAKKTLENLIKKNPNEAKGYYLLGRIQYKRRDLKDAEKSLGKVFEIEKKAPVQEYVLVEAMAYRILTLHLEGKREDSVRVYAQWAGRFGEERIRFLDLDEQDRSIFVGIAESEAAAAEMTKLQGQGDSAVGGEPAQEQTREGSIDSGEAAAGNLVPLEQVDTEPVLIKRVDPRYPPSAEVLGIEGQVRVNALISETGNVVDVVVVQGLAGGFNDATVTAVMQWKYEPAVKDGAAVRVWKPITINFKRKLPH